MASNELRNSRRTEANPERITPNFLDLRETTLVNPQNSGNENLYARRYYQQDAQQAAEGVNKAKKADAQAKILGQIPSIGPALQDSYTEIIAGPERERQRAAQKRLEEKQAEIGKLLK